MSVTETIANKATEELLRMEEEAANSAKQSEAGKKGSAKSKKKGKGKKKPAETSKKAKDPEPKDPEEEEDDEDDMFAVTPFPPIATAYGQTLCLQCCFISFAPLTGKTQEANAPRGA